MTILYISSKQFSKHLNKKDKKFIFSIQEEEHSKLSRELHDTIVQNIRAIRLNTETLEVTAQSEGKKQEIVNDMTDIMVQLRNICYNFHPAELSIENNSTELISIIDTLCQQFITKTKIPCHIQVKKDFKPPKFDSEKSLNIVRAFQEALLNIEKHSYATNVQVLIQCEKESDADNKESLIIFIIDDGIGAEVQKLGKSKTNFGIRNMKERIAAADGEIEFFSTPNEGLTVRFKIPF